jgi:hypothetical protein
MGAQASIDLVVNEAGAVNGLTRFQQRAMAAFQGPRQQAQSLDEQIKKLSTSIDSLAASGIRAGGAQAEGHDTANRHALTNLDTVRLLRDDLGVRIPRAMEKLISSTKAFQVVASAAFSGLALVGTLELVGAIGDKLSEWGHYLLGDTKAMQDLHKEIVAANNERLSNPQNSAVAESSRVALQNQIKALQAKKDMSEIDKELDSAIYKDSNLSATDKERMERWTPADEEALMTAQKTYDQLLVNDAKRRNDMHKDDVRQERETTEIALDGIRKVAQARANAHAEIYDKVHGTNGAEKSLTPDEGKQQDALIDAKYGAEMVVEQRKYADEVRQAWEASFESRLVGEERAYQETVDRVKEFEIKARRNGRTTGDGQTLNADALGEEQAMWIKYNDEKAQRLKQFTDETIQMTAQANIAQSEGTARLLVEETSALNQLDRERQESGRKASEYDQMYADRSAAIRAKTSADINRSLKEYSESERSLYDQMASSSSRGYTKIGAEEKQKDDQALKEYEKMTNGMDLLDGRRQAAYATYQMKLADIHSDSTSQIADLHRRNTDDTADLEGQAGGVRSGARGKGLNTIFSQEQQQTAKINAEYQKRLTAMKEAEEQGVLTHEEAIQRKQAIDDLYNSQIQQQQNELRDKLAGSIEQGFKDPFGTIRKEMQHEMAQMIADWVMQLDVFKRVLGGTFAGTVSGAGAAGRGTGGLFTGAAGGSSFGGSPVGMLTRALGMRSSSTTAAPASSPGSRQFSGSSSTSAPSDFLGVGMGLGLGSSSPSPLGMVSDLSSLTRTGAGAYDALRNTASSAGVSSPADASVIGAVTDGGSVAGQASKQTSALASDSSASAGASAALGFVAAGAGAYSGFMGVEKAYESGNSGGVLSGAMSGAGMGASIGSLFGPEGALIGGGVGAAAGAIAGIVGDVTGEGGRLSGAKYYKQTTLPAMEKAEQDYLRGNGDSSQALGAVDSAGQQGFSYIAQKFGSSAADWVMQQYISKERDFLDGEIRQMAAGGRDYMSRAAVQYHTGGLIDDFGDLAVNSQEGYIKALRGEIMANPTAAANHGPMIHAMNAGASAADVVGMYLNQGAKGTSSAPASGVTHNHTYNISTMDAGGVKSWLNNGGTDLIVDGINRRNANYSGDSN